MIKKYPLSRDPRPGLYNEYNITQVRMTALKSDWLVEYRRESQWFFDKFWWFNDGVYKEYEDALARAELLSSRGKIRVFKPSHQIYFYC